MTTEGMTPLERAPLEMKIERWLCGDDAAIRTFRANAALAQTRWELQDIGREAIFAKLSERWHREG